MPAAKYSFTCKSGRIEEIQGRLTSTLHRVVGDVAKNDSRKREKWAKLEGRWSESDYLTTINRAIRRHECRFIDEAVELGIPPDSQEYQDTTVVLKVERLDEGKDTDRIVAKVKQKYFDWNRNKGRKTNERTFQALLVIAANMLRFGEFLDFKTEGRITRV